MTGPTNYFLLIYNLATRADSLDTIKVTHSHYFVTSTGDLFEQLAHELLAGGTRR